MFSSVQFEVPIDQHIVCSKQKFTVHPSLVNVFFSISKGGLQIKIYEIFQKCRTPLLLIFYDFFGTLFA